MKSSGVEAPVTFADLQAVLLALVKTRINNGHFTERGLARVLGVSQPQLHNVMAGKRRLQTDLADRILMKFGISTSDLVTAVELGRRSGDKFCFVPQLASLGSLASLTTGKSEKKGPRSELYRPPADDRTG